MRRSLIIAGLIIATSCTSGRRAATPPSPPVVTSRPGMANVARSSWSSARLGRDGRTLTVFFTGGAAPCGILDHVEANGSASAVKITIFLGADPSYVASLRGTPLVCSDVGVARATVIRLEDGLGGRGLIDGSTDQRRPVDSG